MKQKSRKRTVLAWLLCVWGLTAFLFSFGQAQWLAYQGAYQTNGYTVLMDDVEQELLSGLMNNLTAAFHDVSQTGGSLAGLDTWYGEYDPNFFYTIRDADGELVASSEVLGDYRARMVVRVDVEGPQALETVEGTYSTYEERTSALAALKRQYEEVIYELTEYEDGEGNQFYSFYAEVGNAPEILPYTLSGFIRYELTPSGHIYQEITRAQALYSYAEVYLALLILGAIFGVVGLLMLLIPAGRRPDTGEIALTWLDRTVPTDLLVLGWLVAALSTAGITASIVTPSVFTALLGVPVLAAFVALLAVGLLSLVRRGRAKCLTEKLFFRDVARRGGGTLSRSVRRLWDGLLEKLPLVWAVGAALVLAFALEALLLMVYWDTVYWDTGDGFLALCWFLIKILEAEGILWAVLAMRRLQEGGKKLAQGDLAYTIPLDKLKWVFREHGEQLNSMRAAIQAAVEEQMKSERMKTELITNVSHDIKTPLTSIVSYVDLLKKQEMPTQEAKEYLDVLDRQSAKLKKLTEDLVEAAKASTGNMTVYFQPTDVNVLLSQTAGEYQERLQSKELSLILNQAQESPMISADGRLLWRVFENLMSNIHKYALPGTRVYLRCEATEHHVIITFRNISATPLNITADELQERFVRGDDARHTEGSGLGLSIARSLTQLQKGSFDIAIDGDLFKATLTFPRLS